MKPSGCARLCRRCASSRSRCTVSARCASFRSPPFSLVASLNSFVNRSEIKRNANVSSNANTVRAVPAVGGRRAPHSPLAVAQYAARGLCAGANKVESALFTCHYRVIGAEISIYIVLMVDCVHWSWPSSWPQRRMFRIWTRCVVSLLALRKTRLLANSCRKHCLNWPFQM